MTRNSELDHSHFSNQNLSHRDSTFIESVGPQESISNYSEYLIETPRGKNKSRKALIEKIMSPRRNKESVTESNDYLLYKLEKEKEKKRSREHYEQF